MDAFSGEERAYAIISKQFASEVIVGIFLCCGNLKDLDIYKVSLQDRVWDSP